MQTQPEALWDDLRVLLALHRHRSFLAVGKALGISTSTAARRISSLEAALGRTLVHRGNAGTSIEPDALTLVALAEQLELGLKAVRRDESEEALSGSVRVSMGEGFVRPATRVLSDLRRRHPGLQLEVMSEVRLVDVARREADIAIRKVRSGSSALVQRPVGRLGFGLYAAQAYVERRLRGGRLASADFARHEFIGYEGPLAQGPHMRWLRAHGAKRFVFLTNSDFALQEAAEQGEGICVLADAQAGGVPGLMRLAYEEEPPVYPVFLVFHRELRAVPRYKLVIGALDTALRAALAGGS